MRFFDALKELLILTLLHSVTLLGMVPEPSQVLSDLLDQLDHITLVF
jgi:hypothetical protein